MPNKVKDDMHFLTLHQIQQTQSVANKLKEGNPFLYIQCLLFFQLQREKGLVYTSNGWQAVNCGSCQQRMCKYKDQRLSIWMNLN